VCVGGVCVCVRVVCVCVRCLRGVLHAVSECKQLSVFTTGPSRSSLSIAMKNNANSYSSAYLHAMCRAASG
jgi:hypothetical protein